MQTRSAPSKVVDAKATITIVTPVMHGDKLLSGSCDNTINVWSTDTWTCERTLEAHDGDVECMVIHGEKLMSGSDDCTTKVCSN
jgi:WD40 repeat protein